MGKDKLSEKQKKNRKEKLPIEDKRKNPNFHLSLTYLIILNIYCFFLFNTTKLKFHIFRNFGSLFSHPNINWKIPSYGFYFWFGLIFT